MSDIKASEIGATRTWTGSDPLMGGNRLARD